MLLIERLKIGFWLPKVTISLYLDFTKSVTQKQIIFTNLALLSCKSV